MQCGEVCPTALRRNTIARNNIIYICIYIYIYRSAGQPPKWGVAAAKLWFGSRQTRVWQLPHSSLAAGQPPHWGLAVAKPEFGSCQTSVWQLPNPSVAAAKSEFGRRYISNIKRQSANQHPHILFEIKINTMTWGLQSVGRGLFPPHGKRAI